MTAIQLEVRKAHLAREILNSEDETLIDGLWKVINHHQVISSPTPKDKEKREIGFLKGKAEVVFHDDFKMTPEELGMV
jgi:hypothetical protein